MTAKPSLKKLPLKRRKAVSLETTVSHAPLSPGRVLPLLVKPEVDGVDLIAWAADHKDLIKTKLHTHGGILFRGFNMVTPELLNTFIRTISGETLEYRERSSPRHQVRGNIYTSTDYAANQSIFPHNENSYQHTWPMKIFFQCVIAAEEGGETPIVDCRALLGRIDPEIRSRFETKGVMYLRNFSESLGLPWQTVFQTDDQQTVDEYCRKNGLETEWKPDGGLRTRSVRAAVLAHPADGTEVWFNHAAFFHVTTLETETREGLLAAMDEEDLPSNTYYGDGTSIEMEVLDHLREAYRAETVVFPWQRGDLLMLDNMLAAHSRTPFRGERQILVGMAEPLNRDQI
jgi:alpha-ketoglutarate-dependent taurine dioxygenase